MVYASADKLPVLAKALSKVLCGVAETAGARAPRRAAEGPCSDGGEVCLPSLCWVVGGATSHPSLTGRRLPTLLSPLCAHCPALHLSSAAFRCHCRV